MRLALLLSLVALGMTALLGCSGGDGTTDSASTASNRAVGVDGMAGASGVNMDMGAPPMDDEDQGYSGEYGEEGESESGEDGGEPTEDGSYGGNPYAGGGATGPPPGANMNPYAGDNPYAGGGASGPPAGYSGNPYSGGNSGPPAGYPGGNPYAGGGPSGPPVGMSNAAGAGGNPYAASQGYEGEPTEDAMISGGEPASGGQAAAAGSNPGGAAGFFAGLFGGLGGQAEQETVQRQQDTLATAAQRAFAEGRGQDAMKLLYGSIISGEEGSKTLLENIKWVDGMKQPMLALRWGVGVRYTAPKNYSGDPKPIGTRQNIPGRRGRSRSGDSGGGPSGYGPGFSGGEEGDFGNATTASTSGHQLISSYAGDLGDQVMQALEERLLRGDFGAVLQKAAQSPVTAQAARTAGGPLGGGNFSGDFSGEFSGEEEDYEGEPTESEMQSGNPNAAGSPTFSAGAPPGAGNPSISAGPPPDAGNPYAGGYPGAGPPGGPAGMPMNPYAQGGYPGAGGPAQMGQADGGQPAAGRAQQMTPGIVMLGKAELKELQQMASEQQLDLLLIFDVKVESPAPNPKTGLVTTNTSVDIYDMHKGKKVFAGKAVGNIEVQLAQEDPRFAANADLVEERVERLMEEIETHYTMTELPEGLTPQNTLGRLTTLVSSPHENPLPALAEVRFYRARGLINDEILMKAYQRLAGDEAGKALATGSEEQKKQALKQWLP